MANQLSGQTGPSPRSYQNHSRHDHYARVRHSKQELAFLTAQATRLSTTSDVVFAKMQKYGATRVATAADLAALP